MVLLSWSMARISSFIVSRSSDQENGAARSAAPTFALLKTSGRELGLEDVLVGHLVVGVVEEVVVRDALRPGELRVRHLGEESVFALQLRRDHVPGLELLLEHRARRAQ